MHFSFTSSLFGVTSLVCLFVAVAQGAKCPTAQSAENLDESKLMGRWFVQHLSTHGLQMPKAKCMIRTLTDEGKKIRLSVAYLDNENGQARNSGDILTKTDGKPGWLVLEDVYINDVHVHVATDNTDYDVFYACLSVGDCEGYYVIGMTREQEMTPLVREKLTAALRDANLANGLTKMDQKNCQ